MTEIHLIYSLYGFNMIKHKDTDSNIFISNCLTVLIEHMQVIW